MGRSLSSTSGRSPSWQLVAHAMLTVALVAWYQQSGADGRGKSSGSSSALRLASIASAKPTAVDESTIHTFHAVCGDGMGETFSGYTVIKSMLQARARGAQPTRQLHVHLAVDAKQAALLASATLAMTHPAIADVLGYIRGPANASVTLTLHRVEDMGAAVDDAIGAGAAAVLDSIPEFRHCSSVRLKAPFLPALRSVDRLAYIDYDAVVLCDLAGLWRQFDDWPDATVFAATEEAPHAGFPSAYRPLHPPGAPKLPTAYASGMNAGVLLLRLDRLRPQVKAYWAEVARIVAASGYRGHPAVQAGTSHARNGLAYGEE